MPSEQPPGREDDLTAGANTVQIGSSTVQAVSNVSIVLVDVPGGVPVLPGSQNAYPH